MMQLAGQLTVDPSALVQFVNLAPPKRQPLPGSKSHVVVCEVVCANSRQTINAKLSQLNTNLAHYMADSTSPADSMCPLDIVKRPVRRALLFDNVFI